MHLASSDPVLLMCNPDFFAVREPSLQHGAANAFEEEGFREYRKDPKEFRRQGQKQHTELKRILQTIGITIHEIEAVPEKPDLVFTADPTLSLVITGWDVPARALTILSLFSNEERQTEVPISANYIERNLPGRAIVQAYHRMEGAGDNVYDPHRDVFWSGFVPNASRENASNGRSDIRAHSDLATITGVEVVSLAVKRPFFHVDTSIAPLSKGHIVCYKDGLQPDAHQTLLKNAFDRFDLPAEEYLINVDWEDARRYACNLQCFGDTVVMPLCSQQLQDAIRRAGYEVVTTDMSRFIHAGGAVHCLTNNVNQRRSNRRDPFNKPAPGHA